MKIFMISAGLIIIFIIGIGLIKWFEFEQAKSLISYGTKEINKMYKPKIIKKRKILVSEKVWIKGKTLKECMKDNKELNNNTVKCRNGYYKEIKVLKYI